MIILMLFIRRNLKLNTLQMLQKRDDFDFPIVNFTYLNSNIPESLHMVFLFHSWYVMLGFVRNMKIFGSILVSKILISQI